MSIESYAGLKIGQSVQHKTDARRLKGRIVGFGLMGGHFGKMDLAMEREGGGTPGRISDRRTMVRRTLGMMEGWG